ncbi:MAG TPA: FecR domain-containing protein [Usitatibacteraceae bacterium]|nr:FecR domain-containing protein [Usitatibacteraceae bacterium]
MKRFASMLLACLAWAGAAAAAPQASVESVQYPAWLERGGAAVPLAPGTALQPNDRLRTGASARARVRLADGSTVKLGEKAVFAFERGRSDGLLRNTLRVLAGAFRYTSFGGARGASPAIRVRNVTIGIRGTDLWGKSTDERDLVCLIDGAIGVSSPGNPEVRLDKPLDFYQLPRGGEPAVDKVSEAQLDEWALETEMQADGAVGKAGGGWRVVAARTAQRNDALALGRRLRAAGFPARLVEEGPGSFATVVAGLESEPAAKALAANLRASGGVAEPVVER